VFFRAFTLLFLLGSSSFFTCSALKADDAPLGPERPVVTPDDQLKALPADTTKRDRSLDGLAEMLDSDPSFGPVTPGDFPFDEVPENREIINNQLEAV
jgi:hypothetical protein